MTSTFAFGTFHHQQSRAFPFSFAFAAFATFTTFTRFTCFTGSFSFAFSFAFAFTLSGGRRIINGSTIH
jgi:hypothetical protein